MKKIIWMLALVAMVCFVSLSKASTEDENKRSIALRIIKSNAEEIRHDASIYQWNRVNREVDRIVAAEKTLQKMSSASSLAKELHQTVDNLRKGRLNRNVEQIVTSADHLMNLVSK